jgi:hypothetical protein
MIFQTDIHVLFEIFHAGLIRNSHGVQYGYHGYGLIEKDFGSSHST